MSYNETNRAGSVASVSLQMVSLSKELDGSSQRESRSNMHPVTPRSSESNSKNSTKQVWYLPATCFAVILEDTLLQLEILDKSNNQQKILKVQADMDYLNSIKYDVAKDKHADPLKGMDCRNLNSSINKIKKLDADRKYVNRVLRETFLDLAVNSNFDSLPKHLDEYNAQLEYNFLLIEEETKNRGTRKELTKQIRQQRNHFKSLKYDLDVTIDKLKSEVEDCKLISEIRKRYVENWQNSRAEQHSQSLCDEDNVPATKTEYFKTRIDYEERVHLEVELLISIIINETQAKIEEWMDKYDEDMENLDLKIQIKKNHYQDMLEKRELYEKTLADHEEAIQNWIDFKVQREKERKYREKMTTSAIIVQAWWRGLLVRRELGPFRRKKKKKEKKKPLW